MFTQVYILYFLLGFLSDRLVTFQLLFFLTLQSSTPLTPKYSLLVY